jgi:hypothetical protein
VLLYPYEYYQHSYASHSIINIGMHHIRPTPNKIVYCGSVNGLMHYPFGMHDVQNRDHLQRRTWSLNSASRWFGPYGIDEVHAAALVPPHGVRGETRLVHNLRDFLDNFEFETSSEPNAIEEGELDKLKSKLKHVCAALRVVEDRMVADDYVRLWLWEL